MGFGSTFDFREPGVDHFRQPRRFPSWKNSSHPPLILEQAIARFPFEARSVVNISGMSCG